MGNKKLSDFIRNNIPGWDYDEEMTKYPPINTAPDWFLNINKIVDEWRPHINGDFKYDGFNYINHNQQHYSYSDKLPPNTFALFYKINKDLKPVRISESEDINNVSKYGLQEIIEASINDLKFIWLNRTPNSRHNDEERWIAYYQSDYEELKKAAQDFYDCFHQVVATQEATYDEACEMYSDAFTSAEKMAKFLVLRNPLPSFFHPISIYDIKYDEDSKIIQVDFTFPNYKDVDIVVGLTARYNDKFASPTAKRKIVKETLYSLIIWIGHVLSMGLKDFNVEQIAINVDQTWFDPATGKQVNGVIASVLGATDYFRSLNIEKVEPIACMRQLKGITTPSLENQSPIRPIFDLNMDDKRFIDTKDIDGTLEEGENLAAMDWEDFEQLVGQLFRWEFAKDGAEVKVTQASRDRGVDAILFDPDPIRGGKYVLQAKRYTRTVDVASVRDLYGTVMNEGANRGILITTSSYGPDSYEFAKDKPISLVDGPNLIQMLRKHNKNYKIDLKEARDILGLN